MDLHDPAAVEPAKQHIAQMAKRLAAEGGGLISIFYHPCEWVHQEFWDGVNFRRGANPPREQWKAPPQRPPEQTEAAFRRFAEYIDDIRSQPGVHFVTAGDLPLIYPDVVRSEGASEKDIGEIATRLIAAAKDGLDFQVIEDRAYSVADQFELLTTAVCQLIGAGKPAVPIKLKGLLGPDNSPPQSDVNHLAWPAFRDTTLDLLNYIETEHRVPARVFVGADAVAPGAYLVALAEAYDAYRRNGKLPTEEGLALPGNPELLPAQHVAQDTPGLFGGWIIHKEGFRAPKVLEVARLQAWTLKPAIRKP